MKLNNIKLIMMLKINIIYNVATTTYTYNSDIFGFINAPIYTYE